MLDRKLDIVGHIYIYLHAMNLIFFYLLEIDSCVETAISTLRMYCGNRVRVWNKGMKR